MHTLSEVEELFNVTRPTIYRWISRKMITPIIQRRDKKNRYFISDEDFESFKVNGFYLKNKFHIPKSTDCFNPENRLLVMEMTDKIAALKKEVRKLNMLLNFMNKHFNYKGKK